MGKKEGNTVTCHPGKIPQCQSVLAVLAQESGRLWNAFGCRFFHGKKCGGSYLWWEKPCHKPPIREWFIEPIYGEIEDDWFLFYQHYLYLILFDHPPLNIPYKPAEAGYRWHRCFGAVYRDVTFECGTLNHNQSSFVDQIILVSPMMAEHVPLNLPIFRCAGIAHKRPGGLEQFLVSDPDCDSHKWM